MTIGGEHTKIQFHLPSCGIGHLTPPPHTPEHKGYAERRHHHIVETSLTLLSHVNMPLKYWSNTFSTVTYLINHLPTSTLHIISPYQLLFKTSPNYNELRSFGYLC